MTTTITGSTSRSTVRNVSTPIATKLSSEKKINGKHYAFDERGVMTYQWTLTTTSDATTASNWLYLVIRRWCFVRPGAWFIAVTMVEHP